MVPEDADFELVGRPQFVVRAGAKLANALDAFGLDVTGADALDVGASTGGFTDCLLQRGAAHVAAVDVADGEVQRPRSDERVTVIERTNARTLGADALPYRPDLIVVDVSFISLRKVLPAVLACAAPTTCCDDQAAVRGRAGAAWRRCPGGAVRRGVLLDAWRARRSTNSVPRCLASASSRLPGPRGNRETFVWLTEARTTGALDGLDAVHAAARVVEP